MRIVVAAIVVLVNGFVGAAAMAAEDFPAMRVMSGMPNMGKGQWTINVLEGGGGPGAASVCFDSLAQMTRGPQMPEVGS